MLAGGAGISTVIRIDRFVSCWYSGAVSDGITAIFLSDLPVGPDDIGLNPTTKITRTEKITMDRFLYMT